MGNLSKYSRHRAASHPRAAVPVIYRDGYITPSWNVTARLAPSGSFYIRCFATFEAAIRHAETICRFNECAERVSA